MFQPSLPNDGDWSRNETFSLTQLKKENSMASRMCELKRVEVRLLLYT